MEKSTIFDDVFKTLLERCEKLIIPVINEIFGTDYSMNEEVTLWSNELIRTTSEGKNRKKITDSIILIRQKTYHIECQANPDVEMEIRMIEYDFRISEDRAHKTENGEWVLEFPKSAVIYLRHTKNTPEELRVRLILPDGTETLYRIPAVKLQKYDKEELFDKELFFFIPYYILKYEKELEKIAADEERLNVFKAEYQDIFDRLQSMQEKKTIDATYLYMLVDVTTRLVSYVSKGNKKIEGVNHMGGKVLRLEYDDAIEKGIERGTFKLLASWLQRGKIGLQEALEESENEEAFLKYLQEEGIDYKKETVIT